MQKVGFILFILGCAGMDNIDMVVPAVMILSGLTILAAAALKEKSKEHCDKAGVNSQEYFGKHCTPDSKTA